MIPRITLRELFAFVAMLAVGLGWLADHLRMSQEIERLTQITHDQKAGFMLAGLCEFLANDGCYRVEWDSDRLHVAPRREDCRLGSLYVYSPPSTVCSFDVKVLPPTDSDDER